MDIILADDQYEVREAYKCLLDDQVGVCLVSEATSATELLEQIEQRCPDLVLLDWELAGLKGAELMTRARAVCPKLQVIALSVRPEAHAEALQAGAQGFVSKGDPPERLTAAIHNLMFATRI
jgi:DNA-binding NarL/FixJ family response regulator